MEQPLGTPRTGSRGRLLFWSGIALAVLGIIIYAVQFQLLKQLTTPWYAPVLATVGVLFMLVAIRRRPSIVRLVGLALVGLVCVFEWHMLLSHGLPKYVGPAEAGQSAPTFTATRADGSPFTDRDLAYGTPTALVFFRGRW